MGAGLGGVWGWTRELLLIRHSFPGDHAPVALSSGATLFVSASAIALLASTASLVWADPGGFRARRKILVQLQRGHDPIAVDIPTEEQSAAIPTATLRVRSTTSSDGDGA